MMCNTLIRLLLRCVSLGDYLSDMAIHRAPRGLALARPLPRVPLPSPRDVPPLTAGPGPPTLRLLSPELGLDVNDGAVNFDEAREGFGRVDIYEVSEVLDYRGEPMRPLIGGAQLTKRLSRHHLGGIFQVLQNDLPGQISLCEYMRTV